MRQGVVGSDMEGDRIEERGRPNAVCAIVLRGAGCNAARAVVVGHTMRARRTAVLTLLYPSQFTPHFPFSIPHPGTLRTLLQILRCGWLCRYGAIVGSSIRGEEQNSARAIEG